MSEKQIVIKILEKMPDNISMDSILETLILIYDLKNRLDNFDESQTINHEQLKKEIKEW